ncbi:MAG: hypothetical protein GXP35_04555 [Actinobacteria bacterium]|nr:hypothetical protein [Actinomycetota bacterium]
MREIKTGRLLRLLLVLATLAGASIISAPSSTVIQAAPIYPDCLGDDDDDTDVDCLPYSDTAVKPVIIGSFGQGNLTIRTSFTYNACDWYIDTRNCYFSVDLPTFDGCFYIDKDEPKGVKSCGSYRDMYLTPPSGARSDHFSYSSGTATNVDGSLVTNLACRGAYSTVYGEGGDSRTDWVWRTRGPNTANCDIEVNLPVPDKLQGTTYLRVKVGGRLCAANSLTNCSISERVTGYAWLPVFGTLDPALGLEEEDPPITPTEPERVADTRDDGETSDGEAQGEGLVRAGTSRRIQVTGRANVPDNARGVILNVVAVGPDRNGYLTLYPCDEDVPSTSSLNYQRGQVVANSAILQLAGDGAICVFSSADVHVVVDVTSYIGQNGTITTIVPTRFVETREGYNTDDGMFAGIGEVAAGEPLEVEIAGRGDVPDDADAVAVNLTIVRPENQGYATLYPCDGESPNASNVNFRPGDVRANSAIVPLSDDGTLCVFSSSNTDVVLDVTATIADAEDFGALNPARLIETRPGMSTIDSQQEGVGRLQAGSTTVVRVAGRGGVPADADLVAVNLTAVDPAGAGYLTAFPCDAGLGDTSSVNFGARATVANSGIFALSSDGTLCVYAHEATHMVMDVSAYGIADEALNIERN